MASQNARLSNFEADFKQQQSEMTNKIDTVLKAITDRITGALSSDMVKNPKLNINTTSLVLSARSYPTDHPQCSSHPSNSINAVKKCSKDTNHPQKDQPQPVTEIRTQPEEPEQTLEDEFKDLYLNLPVLEVLTQHQCTTQFWTITLGDSKLFDTLADLGSCVNIIPLYLFKKLNIELLEETNHIFRLANGTKSYPVEIVKDVEVHIGRLKLLNNFYVIDMKRDPETPLLVGRGFLETANAVIDCRKAKIVVGEGITRSVFRVKGIELVIIEYLVNISKRRAFWSLNEDILKINILTTNTPYPSRKIRRIHKENKLNTPYPEKTNMLY
ncbi:DNA-directed DNA polymerase [Tanacetum coccineum]